MAYIDKVTTMRRMALIWAGYKEGESNGAIAYEGVNVEGTCLLQAYEGFGEFLVIEEADLKRLCEEQHMEVKYQDPDGESSWEPREEQA